MLNQRTVVVDHGGGRIDVMDIDEYAKGVLPYEMSSGWPAEALKAQAVAAKSYALAAGRVYTDTRSQVYGLLRHDDTDAAVDAVRGVLLAHHGQIIMPFFFGHCNGHTRSPSQAGWNPVADRSYLTGVACPCGRTRYYGHGIGMCQRGAQTMAERDGKTFDQILRHYYQGIELLGRDNVPSQPTVRPANAELYVIQRGDTLSAIATRFGTTWQLLHCANRDRIADPDRIEPGWEIVIPREAEEEGEAKVYVVQAGDMLGALARRWGTTVRALVALNSISNPNLIRVGQRLLRP